VVHDHTFAFEQNADPPPLGTSLRDALPGSGIAEPTPLAGDLLHLLACLSAVRRAFTPDCLWVDTNKPAGPTLRDFMVPHRFKRCLPPLA